MREVEVKILEINPGNIKSRLRRIGARKLFDGSIHALYFDFNSRKLKGRGQVLRLRRKGDTIELAFKQKLRKKAIRIMDEFETHVEDWAGTQKVLKGLGFKVIKEVRKHRISYGLGTNRFEIDKYPGIPPFLEIESRTVKSLKSMVKRLGFRMRDANAWNTFDVLRHYKQGERR